jgi:exopolysaccharide production protein ExoZ
MTERRDDLATIQALRAIAALMVVAYHALEEWGKRAGTPEPASAIWINGGAGVDIFFVVSGLVMVISARRLASRPESWRIFVHRRIWRIVPLYWLLTTAKIAAVLALPALVARTRLDLPYVIQSYLFLPARDAMGQDAPVLPVGWTLSYEMLFYGLIAAALFLRTSIFRVTFPALALLSVAALFQTPAWPPIGDFANPIVLEFLFGAFIGECLARGVSVAPSVAAALLPLALVTIFCVPMGSGILRPISWGLPAAAIIASAVALEQRLYPVLPRTLLALGDASYSIYLVHGFVVPAVVLVALHSGLPTMAARPIALLGCFVASAVAGLATYALLERPIMHWNRSRKPSIPLPVAE